MPRPLTENEAGVLAALLSVDFPGVAELRRQAEVVLAAPGCTCGCGTIDLHVPIACTPAAVRSRVPVEGTVLRADGEPAGGLLLFVDDGLLSGLEVYPLDDDKLPMPPPERVVGVAPDDTGEWGPA